MNGRSAARLEAAADQVLDITGRLPAIAVGDLNTEAGRKALLDSCPEPDILVTNNAVDFTALYTREEIHAGLVCLNVAPKF